MASVCISPSCGESLPVPHLIRDTTEDLRESFGLCDLLPTPYQEPCAEEVEPLGRASTEALREQFEAEEASYSENLVDPLRHFPGCSGLMDPQLYGAMPVPLVAYIPPTFMDPVLGLPFSEHAEAVALQHLANMTYSPELHFAPPVDASAAQAFGEQYSATDAGTDDVAAHVALQVEPSESRASTPEDTDAVAGGGVHKGPRILPPQVPQTMKVEVDEKNGIFRVILTVPESKLDSKQRMVISQLFEVPIVGGKVPCKLKVSAMETHTGKHGSCFRTSNGMGKVEIKCEDWLPEDAPPLTFTVSVGRDGIAQGPRGPVTHNFRQTSVASLQQHEAEWDFRAAVDASTRSFDVMVEFQLLAC